MGLDDSASHRLFVTVVESSSDIFPLAFIFTRPLASLILDKFSSTQEPSARKDVYVGGSTSGVHCLFGPCGYHRVYSSVLAPRRYVEHDKKTRSSLMELQLGMLAVLCGSSGRALVVSFSL